MANNNAVLDVTKHYSELRPEIQTGDVMAFQGRGWLSSAIMSVTFSDVSHVGIIRRVEENGRVYIIESTTLNKGAPPGVYTSLLSDRLISYDGIMWLLRLSEASRFRFSLDGFAAECRAMDGKEYDKLGVGDFLVRKYLGLRTYPNPGQVFCSCLVSYALEAAGVLPKTDELFPRNQSPQDVCEFEIYKPVYHQLIGKPHQIRRFI